MSGGHQIAARQRNVRHAFDVDCALHTEALHNRLGRVASRGNIAVGDGRDSQRRIGSALSYAFELSRCRDAGVGGGASRTDVTLIGQGIAQAHEAKDRPQHVVSCVSFASHVAKLHGGRLQVPVHDLCPAKPEATLTGVEPVTDGVGKIAAFRPGRARRNRITRQDGPDMPAS